MLTAGGEWDRKAGNHLVDGAGRESTISWRDGTGPDHGTGREHCRETVGNIVGKTVGNAVGKSVGSVVCL